MSDLLVSLLKEDLNEELYMAREAGLGLGIYLTKVGWRKIKASPSGTGLVSSPTLAVPRATCHILLCFLFCFVFFFLFAVEVVPLE